MGNVSQNSSIGPSRRVYSELHLTDRRCVLFQFPKGFILFLVLSAYAEVLSQILDLKGTPKASQNDLFVTITSTRSELERTSFLSSLDMDPAPSAHLTAANLASPATIRPSMFLPSESGSGPSTGDSTAGGQKAGDQKREKFSEFKRFVSFGLRRDSQQTS